MIGVIAKKEEIEIAKEFFELFKTPWEFYQKEKYYDVVIATEIESFFNINAKIVCIYTTQHTNFDDEHCLTTSLIENRRIVSYENHFFPIYKNIRNFHYEKLVFLKQKDTHEAVGFSVCWREKTFIRIGYDLFKEIDFLLTRGQPLEYSLAPTAEFHIQIIRDICIRAEIPLIEILSIPAHYNCIACLTHDVDFTGFRNHVFDRTMFGFLYRASIGSWVDFFKKKKSFAVVLKNARSILLLPFVYLGLAKDFLAQLDKYTLIESALGVNSTFFFVPFKKYPGKPGAQWFSKNRSVKYDLNSSQATIQQLISKGHEVGVHGLDAWCDADRAALEFERLYAVGKNTPVGIRMHWLFFSDESPAILEKTGFLYDSTIGYNDAVGFKAGTAQVFKAKGCGKLLELPLIIQDTALFYPRRMNLKESKALRLINEIMKYTKLFGGVITINWHERSLGPERYWDKIYIHLIKKLKKQKAWFAPASSVVRWFQLRRSIVFQNVYFQDTECTITIAAETEHDLPKFILRVYIPQASKIVDHVISNVSAQRQENISAGALKVAVIIK